MFVSVWILDYGIASLLMFVSVPTCGSSCASWSACAWRGKGTAKEKARILPWCS